MSLSIGIVGLPNVGKSTLFKALTKKQVNIQNYPFCTIDPNVGIVQVPDDRLEELGRFSKSEKVIPTAIEFVDIAGLVKGAAEGEGLGNQFLSHIREVDAILEVVRIFKNDDITHVSGQINPEEDTSIIETELVLADLETVTNRKEKLEKDIKSQDKEAQAELKVVNKLDTALQENQLASQAELTADEFELIRDLQLLTFKPILYLFNSSDNSLAIPEKFKTKNRVIADVKIEEDSMDLTADDKKELGVVSSLDQLINEAYKLLGLITFFTTGPKETRAWTVNRGATAPEAGAAIHSDFQEQFIKAMVINWQDLVKAGSESNAYDLGLVRTEGKDYIVQDGDSIEFKI